MKKKKRDKKIKLYKIEKNHFNNDKWGFQICENIKIKTETENEQ